MLATLQANACDVPPESLSSLSRLSGVPAAAVSHLIYQVRTNACEVRRNGNKVGCALSVLMGWHNHDCLPNTGVTLAENGKVTVTALRDVKEGEELTISYVDPTQPFEARRQTLSSHYGFECRCARCVTEQRKELKQKMKERDAYLAAQRR